MLRSGDDSSKKPPVPHAAPAGLRDQGSGKERDRRDRDMGVALRKVYQQAIEESIPPEMLDLLGKLD